MTEILLVASQNGFGHAKRLYEIAQQINKNGVNCKLLLSQHQIQIIKNEKQPFIQNILIPALSYGVDGYCTTRSIADIEKQTSQLVEKSKAVISDNTLWPLELNSNFYLHAHFVWHHILNDLSEQEYTKEFEKMTKIKIWFQNKFFNFSFRSFENNTIAIQHLKNLRFRVDSLIDKLPVNQNEIWISSGSILSNKRISNEFELSAKHFTFKRLETFRMYELGYKPLFVLGRPGLSTIRDCLAAGVQFFPLDINLDREMKSNIENLKELKLLPADYKIFKVENFELEYYLERLLIPERIIPIWQEASENLNDYVKNILNVVLA